MTQLKLAVILAVALTATTASNCNAQEFGDSKPSASDKPLSLSVSESVATPKPLTYIQQRARFEDQQRQYRIEMRRMVGYSPLRPTVNASLNSYAPTRFYMPRRDVITMPGVTMWYW